jgi:hypothetical protein
MFSITCDLKALSIIAGSTAANSNYYDALQATTYQIHTFLPEFKLIIYDLGLTEEQKLIVIFY